MKYANMNISMLMYMKHRRIYEGKIFLTAALLVSSHCNISHTHAYKAAEPSQISHFSLIK